MEPTQQTIQQIDRAIERTISRFPEDVETAAFTDIHLKISQESGELTSFNDDGEELNRAIISDWIENTDENFFSQVTILLRQRLNNMSKNFDHVGITKPFSFILEDDEIENATELYVVYDDTTTIGEDLMKGLSDDLNNFLDNLLKN